MHTLVADKVSDKNFMRFYAVAWIAMYLITYLFLKSYLPDEYFRDSLTIQKLALPGEDTTDWGGAYGIAVFFSRILPPPVIIALVASLGSFTIWNIVMSIKTVRGMAIIVPVLIPCIILNMMDFGKESFVLPMTYLVLWWTQRARSVPHAVVSIIAVYVIYGLFFRDYYLIILAVFLGCVMVRRASLPFKGLYISLAVFALFLLPPSLFRDLQGDRDKINYLANIVIPVVHTAILNPLPPTSALNFIVNYFYAAYRLTLPFIFRLSASDIMLFLDVLIFGHLTYVGLKNKWAGAMGYLPMLFVAHILVLIIFEPDAGSYLRHASSVIFYLLPSLQLVEERRAQVVRIAEQKRRALTLVT